MKPFFATTILFALTATRFLWGDLNEIQLSSALTMQYEEMQQKNDGSKIEFFLKNSRFILKETSKIQKVIADIDLKGTLSAIANYKENIFEIVRDGNTRLILLNDSDLEESVDITLDGKMIGILNMDFARFKQALGILTKENLSEEKLISILEFIKGLSFEGKDLKIISKIFGKNETGSQTIFDIAKFTYRQTVGTTPEEITLTCKSKQDSTVIGSGFVFKFPNGPTIDSHVDVKILLPEWRKLVAFFRASEHASLPEGVLDLQFQTNCFLGKGEWKSIFTSRNIDAQRTLLDSKIHSKSQLAPGWVAILQSLKKEELVNLDKNEKGFGHEFEEKLYQWLTSPKTLPFLSLLPMQSTFDWIGSITYAEEPKFSLDKASFETSCVGKEKIGLNITFDYKDAAFISQITLIGGRSTLDYGVDLYNRFFESTKNVKGVPQLPPFSAEAKEGLYQLLLKYVAQPENARSEMKFIIKYTKQGAAIVGNKNMMQLQMDIMNFYQQILYKTSELQ